MTFFHFINCICLTFTPLFLLYKFTSLSEYSSYWRCGTAVAGYIGTQIFKVFIFASISENILIAPLVWDQVIDMAGMYFLLANQHKAAMTEVKILSVCLGWCFGESLLTRFFDFYANARLTQFDWRYMMSAIAANINLIQNMSVCFLLWQWIVSRSSSVSLISSGNGGKSSQRQAVRVILPLLACYAVAIQLIGKPLEYKALASLGLAMSTFILV